MILFFRTSLLLWLAGILTACGGGGDGSNTTDAFKYAGTHSYCDNDHTRYRVALTATGNGNYNAVDTDIIYQNSNCTGNVLATYSGPITNTLTFVETAIATVQTTGLAPSLSIDKYRVNTPNTPGSLTGPSVDGSCVNLVGRRICYSLDGGAQQLDVGLYQTNAGFYIMNLENGVYVDRDAGLFLKE